jgi:hypothetical protein
MSQAVANEMHFLEFLYALWSSCFNFFSSRKMAEDHLAVLVIKNQFKLLAEPPWQQVTR